MIRTKAEDQEQRAERLGQVTPEIIERACVHPGVNEMYHSIRSHSGHTAAKMYIWISWFGRGRSTELNPNYSR